MYTFTEKEFVSCESPGDFQPIARQWKNVKVANDRMCVGK